MKACPKCDSAVRPTVGGMTPSVPHEYRCANCSWKGDSPIEREKRGNNEAGNQGLTQELADADPEEWP